jgi:hypothetical protein
MGGDHEVAHVQAQTVLADNGKCSAHYQVPGRRDQPPVTIPAVWAP